MNSAERQTVLHCLKSMIDEAVCEECPLYGTTGTDHCEEDCVRLAINALEQEPCDDAISRQAAIDAVKGWETVPVKVLEMLPSVKPLYTDTEIQKMQDLEFAEIQKAYEIGKLEQEPCTDAISRQAVLDALDKSKYSNEFCEEHHIDWSINLGMAHIVVNELKPVTPQPKMGEWYLDDEWRCSVCNCVCEDWRGIPTYKYCPQCGSYVGKMQEVEE